MSNATPQLEAVIQAGGTLQPGVHVYIERPEDAELLRLLSATEYVNVLTSRQMGKSSLMTRTALALGDAGVTTAAIDIASELTGATGEDAWFRGLLNRLRRDLGLTFDIGEFWSADPDDTSGQKLQRFFREIVCTTIPGRVVVFLDEIDNTLKFDFTDALFTALRGMFNERGLVPEYRRVTFCLLGVAAPNELIKDRRTTAYNVGKTLVLRDFDLRRDDMTPLVRAMSPDPETGREILVRTLYWTGGQPFLTLKFCEDLQREGATTTADVDAYVEQSFATLDRVSDQVHFQQILRFIETRLSSGLEALDVYSQLLQGKSIKERAIPAHLELKLSGLVRRNEDGELTLHNRIYARLFDQDWVRSLLPERTQAVQAAAIRPYQRRLTAAAVGLLAAIAVGGYFGYGYYQAPLEVQTAIVKGDARTGITLTFPRNSRQADLVKALAAVADPQRIVSIDLSSSEITDLAPLRALSGLRELNLGLSRITDIGPLRGLPELHKLTLSFTNVANLDVLASLPNLQVLDVGPTHHASDYAVLAKLTNLRDLDLAYDDLPDLEMLRHLHLTRLSLQGTRIKDPSALRDLTGLTNLSFFDTPLSDLSLIKGMTKLDFLDLEGAKNIRDFSFLSSLTQLRFLDLTGTAITDLAPLRNLHNLQNLTLTGTAITAEQVAELRSVLAPPKGSLTDITMDNPKRP